MYSELAEFVEVQSGHPFRGSIPEDPDGNAYALQMRDVSPESGVAWANLVKTSLDGRKSPEWLKTGDVVFVARGMRNYALCLEDIPQPTVCSQYFFLLRVKSTDLLPAYLAWQINRAPAQRYLTKNAEGTDQLSIRRGVLEALPIAVPPLEQQHHIVALAKAVRRERQVLEALIRNREQQLDALAFELHAANPIHR